MLLRLLVISSKFHLLPNSISMSSKESDQAKWYLVPTSTSHPAAVAAAATAAHKQLNTTEPVIVSESTNNNHKLSTTEKPTDLPPALLPSVSLSRLFNDGIDDGDWSVFMPNSPLDQPSQENSQQPAAEEESGAVDHPSSLEAAPSLEEPSSLEWENGTCYGRDNEHQNEATHPSPTRNSCAVEEEQEQPSTALPPNVPPALFRGLSIESMYSLWTTSTSSLRVFEDDLTGDTSPSKRLKHTSSDGSTRSSNNSSNSKATDDSTTDTVQTDIYKEIHTKILI